MGVTGGVRSEQGAPTVQVGSPPPLMVTLLVTLDGAFGATLTVNANVLLPPLAMTELLVQVMVFDEAEQDQLAALAPLSASGPFATDRPAGSVSVIVMVP